MKIKWTTKLHFQGNEKIARTTRLTLNQTMMNQLGGTTTRKTGAGGGISSTQLVSKSALCRMSTVSQVVFAEVCQNAAREIADFPCKIYEELQEVNRLLGPLSTLSLDDQKRGSVIVSEFLHNFNNNVLRFFF
jgi:hypothetical protein